MPSQINRAQNTIRPMSFISLFWRISLTVIILGVLAGPGAKLLEQAM